MGVLLAFMHACLLTCRVFVLCAACACPYVCVVVHPLVECVCLFAYVRVRVRLRVCVCLYTGIGSQGCVHAQQAVPRAPLT